MGACKKISDHELKDCSFFIINICDIGVFYWHKLQKELEKKIWCYNLRGLYYEAGLQA